MKPTTFTTLTVAAVGMVIATANPAAAALSYDDEYCFVNEETNQTECMNVGFMRKVCKLTDPNSVGEECKDVAKSKILRKLKFKARPALKRPRIRIRQRIKSYR